MKRARLLQWLVFFLFFSSDFSLIAYVPLFVKDSLLPKVLSTWFWTPPKASTSKCKTQKGPLFQFFGAMRLSPPLFRLCETFFRIFSKSSKGPPSIFWCFAPEWMLKKPKGPPFTFLGTMKLLKILIFCFFWKFFLKIFEIFRCLRRVAPSFFWYFATNWIFKKSKGSPLLQF